MLHAIWRRALIEQKDILKCETEVLVVVSSRFQQGEGLL